MPRGLTVKRDSDAIDVVRGSDRVARIHVVAAASVAIQGEQVVSDGYDGMAYAKMRVVCTYGGRCTGMMDNAVVYRVPVATRLECTKDGYHCLLVPKRRKQRDTLEFDMDGDMIDQTKVPALAKGERITGLDKRENKVVVVIKDRAGNERTEPL